MRGTRRCVNKCAIAAIAVIVMTAHGRVKLEHLAADGLLTKPFKLPAMMAAFEQLARRREA